MKIEKEEKLSVIVGLGKTGMSCARYFVRKGIPFAVQDSNVAPTRAAELRDLAPQASLSLLNSEALCKAGVIVLSQNFIPFGDGHL